MKKITGLFVALMLVSVLVFSGSSSITFADGGDDVTPTPGTHDEPGGPPDGMEPGAGDLGPGEDAQVDETQDREPVFEPGYDDSWTEDFPQVVDGYNVRYINTPKSMACLNTPMVSLQSTHPTLEEFLADPPDMTSLNSALNSLPDIPSNVLISFSPKPVDVEASAEWETDWNLKRLKGGCLEPLADIEKIDRNVSRGYAVFQNTDAGDYTDDHGQSVKITSPSDFGDDQVNWSAALNNVATNTDYFLQAGMVFDETEPIVAWTDETRGLNPVRYQSVGYSASTRYQFQITYWDSVWQMCAGNDEDIENEYECVLSRDATGTHLKEDPNTSVWFENANGNSDWHERFPSRIYVSHAKIHRNGVAYSWTSEDRLTVHRCPRGRFPVAGAMSGTLTNGRSTSWKISGVPYVCPR